MADVTQNVPMHFVLPLRLAAGFADWLCHRAANMATTTIVEKLMRGELVGRIGDTRDRFDLA